MGKLETKFKKKMEEARSFVEHHSGSKKVGSTEVFDKLYYTQCGHVKKDVLMQSVEREHNYFTQCTF